MNLWILATLMLTSTLFGAEVTLETSELSPIESPAEIRQELNQANADLASAQKMFNPWYTGPIIAGSASMTPVGSIIFQPYLFLVDDYATFNHHRRSIDHPSIWQFNPNFVLQTGLTSWMDISVTPQFFTNHIHSQWSTHFGDLPVQIGFKICDEGRYLPKMKVAIGELFPTGPYQRLKAKKEGIDATGGGSFVTSFSYRASKVLFWWTDHPIATRMVLSYNIPSTVKVHGLNVYGGGVGTKGKVRPGNSFNADLGIEYSFNQKWVIATDLVYQTNNRTKFNGQTGINPTTGEPNVVGSGSSDYLQVAPALEYNLNENLGIIGGVWVPVYGRNSSNFITYVLSVSYLFSVK